MPQRLEIMELSKNIVCRKYSTPNRPHVHTQWELIVFEKGETDNVVNNKHFNANPGDVFLLGPPHTHAISFKTTPHLHRDFYFSCEQIKAACDMIDDGLFSRISECEELATFHLSSSAFHSIIKQADKIDSLLLMSQKENNLSVDTLQRITFSILHFVLGLYQTNKYLGSPNYPKWMLDVLQSLSLPENFTKPVSEIVSATYYSHATVSNAFKKHLGVTLLEYVVDLRLEYAAELLTNTNQTALEISSAVGYDSFSYFIKQFKRKYRSTPLQYRLQVTCGKNAKKATPPTTER